MEFLFTFLLLLSFLWLGLTARRYSPRVRLMLIAASSMAPLWFFIVWQGAS